MMTAAPMPPPMHRVARSGREFRLAISWTRITAQSDKQPHSSPSLDRIGFQTAPSPRATLKPEGYLRAELPNLPVPRASRPPSRRFQPPESSATRISKRTRFPPVLPKANRQNAPARTAWPFRSSSGAPVPHPEKERERTHFSRPVATAAREMPPSPFSRS